MPALWTRHVYAAGLEPIEEYVMHDPDGAGPEPCTWTLAREFISGERFPEPLVMVDWTAAGDVPAGSEEVLQYIRDALGSVVGLLDAGQPDATPEPVPARLVERYDYDPYGKTYITHWDPAAGSGSGDWVRHEPDEPSAFGNPFMWTGQRHDVAIGLYHFPFRTYSPRLGRWLQRDLLGYVDGVNVYEYVASRPLMFIDPLGELKRDANGELVVENTNWNDSGNVKLGHLPDGRILHVLKVYLFTDTGKRVEAWIVGRHNEVDGAYFDCHGYTLADGKYWINDDQVDDILREDQWSKVAGGDIGKDGQSQVDVRDIRPKDIIVLRDRNGKVIHSMKVVHVDGYFRVVLVEHNAGMTVEIRFESLEQALRYWYQRMGARRWEARRQNPDPPSTQPTTSPASPYICPIY
jgi:RHS repeat-associated protein